MIQKGTATFVKNKRGMPVTAIPKMPNKTINPKQTLWQTCQEPRTLVTPDMLPAIPTSLSLNSVSNIYFSISCFIICSNTLYGCAPTIFMPFIKNDGVPVTPYFVPSFRSSLTSEAIFPESRQLLNFSMFNPRVSAYCFKFETPIAFWFLLMVQSCLNHQTCCTN